MSRLVSFTVALLLAGTMVGCGHTRYPLAGTWRMVFPAVAPADTSSGGSENGAGAIKVLNRTHFAFGIWTPDGQIFAGGGRYKYDGKTYTETIQYHFDPRLVGRSIKFTCLIKGDTWYHSGALQENGQWFEMNEVWRRVE